MSGSVTLRRRTEAKCVIHQIMTASLPMESSGADARTPDARTARLAVDMLDATLGRDGDELLRGVARALAKSLGIDYVLVCERDRPTATQASTLVAWMHGELVSNFTLLLADSPCGETLERGECYAPSDVRKKFPKHVPLDELEVEGYFGVAVPGRDGQALGHLALMCRAPLDFDASLRAFIIAQARLIGTELQRRQAQRAVREREQLFGAIADALPVCIAYVDALEIYRFVNQTFAGWQDRSREEIIGSPVREVLTSDAYARVKPRIDQALAGQPQRFESAAVYPDGQRREVEIQYLPYVDESRRQSGYFALTTDLTERRQAERERRELDACFRAVTLAAFEGIAVLEDGRFVNVNDSYAQRLRFRPEELIGKSYEGLLSKDSLQRVRRVLDSRFQGVYEVVARSRSGKTFPAEICGVNVDVGGRNLRVSAARDISARVAREQAVAEAADHEQTRIGQDLHDSLGQGLAGLSLGLERLRRDLKDKQSPLAEQASQLGQALKRAIQVVRTISRGLAPMLGEGGDLEVVLARLVEDTEDLHGIECVSQLDGARQVQDANDATQVYRIAQEALANAVRHGRATQVRVQADCSGGLFHLTIDDDGSGLPAGPSRPGLGMRSMTSRARILGGNLTFDSGEQGGTRVSLTFPLRS